MLSRRSLVLAGLTLAPVSTFRLPLSASAQGEPSRDVTLTIAPVGDDADLGYFSLMLEPGEDEDLQVQVSNAGTDAAIARTYAADAFTLTNGGLNALLDGDPVSGPTTWLDFPRQDLDLDGQSGEILDFTVQVPGDTPPGQYITCLVVQNAEVVPGSGGIAFDQVIRQVIAVAIDVPGSLIPGVTIGPVRYDTTSGLNRLTIEVVNTGNVHLRPTAEIGIESGTGDGPRVRLALGTVFAGLAVTIETALDDPLPPGTYSVTLTLTDETLDFTSTSDPLALEVESEATPVAATPVPPPIVVSAVTTEDVRSDDTLQLVSVNVTIDNQGPPVGSARVTLRVERDGELVEDIVLGEDISFPGGESSFSQRYLPLDGWVVGTYRFTAILELVDPGTGDVQELSSLTADPPVIVAP